MSKPTAHPGNSAKAGKLRLDKLLVDRGLAASRERAQALILAGRVLVEEQKVTKPGTPVAAEADLRMLGDDLRYVSRGGLKLEGALKAWGIDVSGRACADIGASTGGFTDCLLQHGAISVLAVDTGYGQIAHKLRVDPRVSLMERTNARTLRPGGLAPAKGPQVCNPAAAQSPAVEESIAATQNQAAQESSHPAAQKASHPAALRRDLLLAAGPTPHEPLSFFAIDVSFIGVSLVLPPLLAALAPEPGSPWRGEAVILVKPQFEAGREHVGKGGIVRDPAAHRLAVDRVAATVRALHGEVLATMDSPILGMEGNREFLLHARF